MNATIYINTPLSKAEHDRIAALATKERRSKGQQLRILALAALGVATAPKKEPRRA